MNHVYKLLSLLLAILTLVCLCACHKPEAETPASTDHQIVIPSSIYGTWYPHPDMGDITVEINADGTLTRDGKKLNWTADNVTADKVTLIVVDGDEEYKLIFSQLNFPVPLLSMTTYGAFIQQPELWKYMIEWYCPDNSNSFSLSFFELAQNGCNVIINGNDMKVEVLNANKITHVITLSGEQAIVTDAQGNSNVYIPLN